MDAKVDWRADAVLEKRITDRWCSFGPYYAMFPVEFARKVIRTYTDPGDFVLDPFCGRGTSVFCAGEAGRDGLGIEINPVGWLYAYVKIRPAPQAQVEARLDEITSLSRKDDREIAKLPVFFRKCFCRRVLAFLLTCRRHLDWRANRVDATLMAFVIVYLHGRIGETGIPQALSNQMRQTKAMWPPYSIRWWNENGFNRPPIIDPVAFLKTRITWRYKRGFPDFRESVVKLGDAPSVLSRLPNSLDGQFRLLFTSPPYRYVTSYYVDQWLRLWMLGDHAVPSRVGERWRGRFEDPDEYSKLLDTVFARSARLMADDAVIYVRTDAREFTRDATIAALKKAFPGKKRSMRSRPFKKDTQTALFGDAGKKPGEVDIILR